MQKRIIGFAILALLALVPLSSRAAIVSPSEMKTVRLEWDYPQEELQENSPIVFNIYSTTDLSIPIEHWSLLTNVSETACVLPMMEEIRFFTVAASNTVSHAQSAFSH